MNQPLALSYSAQLATLAGGMAAQSQWPSPDSAFAMHVFQATGVEVPFAMGSTTLSESHRRRLSEGPVLATAGYLLAWNGSDQDLQSAWAAGLARLTARQPFPLDRESFFYRPIELLGICVGLGASNTVAPEHRRWLIEVLEQGSDRAPEADLWTQLLGARAAQVIGVAWRLPRLTRTQDCGLEELALLVWLQLIDPDLMSALGLAGHEQEYEETLLQRTVFAPMPHLDLSRSAVLYAALAVVIERFIRSSVERYWQVGKGERDAVELVRALCSRFHLFALQIQKRHSRRPTIGFDDEYDVQDALHALLRLHFDDVRAEEWAPSYANSASRTDFLLKREQIIIETKVTRTKSRKLEQKEIANQLIIDKERYRTHPDCKTLVCFVYDPDHVCDNVTALESDVSSLGPPLRVVVVVAPTAS